MAWRMRSTTRSTNLLAARGVTRRDFLKFCGSVAAMLGLTEAWSDDRSRAEQASLPNSPALSIERWTRAPGCTESMAQSTTLMSRQIVLDFLSFDYFETIMNATGDSPSRPKDTIEKPRAATS